MKSLILVLGLAAVTLAQQKYYNNNQFAQPTTTPVPILKQLNRHNDDGSYSFGYEAADGSFKIETKHPNGEVYGKYGYVDDAGKVREVEYGASKQRGFEPQGTDINVPPPTTDDKNYAAVSPLGPGEEDDGQYREDPRIYEDPRYNSPASAPAVKQAPRPQYYQPQPAAIPQQHQYQQVQEQEEQYEQPQYRAPQQPQYQQQQYQPQQYQAPQHRFQYAQQRQQPVQQPGYDINTGSYTISYSG